MKGSTKKYVDKKCSMKNIYVLQSCLFIDIYINVHFIFNLYRMTDLSILHEGSLLMFFFCFPL